MRFILTINSIVNTAILFFSYVRKNKSLLQGTVDNFHTTGGLLMVLLRNGF